MQDYVVLIPADDSACRTIARRLRAEHICCEILPFGVDADQLLKHDPRGVIVAAEMTGEVRDIPALKDYLQTGLPMLCMGDAATALCQVVGGQFSDVEIPGGVAQLHFDAAEPIFQQVEDGERLLPAHREMTLEEYQGTPVCTADGRMLGFRVCQRDVWGLAMPMERNDPSGTSLLVNFCQQVCQCTPWWTNDAFIERARLAIQDAAGDAEALCALSGGVDSGVCGILGHMALGPRLHCIFVDTGLLRQGEAQQVMNFYQKQMGLNLRCIDASDEFLTALEGVTDPHEKERIIFGLLREVLNREAAALPQVRLLIQGTNYSDVQTDAPFPMDLPNQDVQIVEPVRILFKDEVRQVGEALGLTPAMTQRQPFPGSGLASRILCSISRNKLQLLREADAIFQEAINQAGLNRRLWQYFAVLSDSPTPDDGLVVTLRAVQAVDGGAGMAARLPGDLLERVTMEILSRCPGVTRVMFDLTPSRMFFPAEGRG